MLSFVLKSYLIVAGIALLTLMQLLSPVASAAGPTATSTVAATPTPVVLDLDTGGLTGVLRDSLPVRWRAQAGVVEYRLVAKFTVTRVNAADPVCAQAGGVERRTVEMDERLAGTATSSAAPLPALPPDDAWLVGTYTIDLSAFGQDGIPIGGVSRSLVFGGGETCETPPPASASTLPRTGAGATPAGEQSPYRAIAAIGLMVAAFVAVAGAWGVRMTR